MLPADRHRLRVAQSLLCPFVRLTYLLGACLWLILPLLVEAGSVSRIYGAASTLPSSIEPLCASPQICPHYWDLSPTEGIGVIYGTRAFASDLSCRKSTDGGRTFQLCPTNYPVIVTEREIDIPANGAILSVRQEGVSSNRCVLDKSTDGGVSWSLITVVAGANLQCGIHDASQRFPGEMLRCVGEICLIYVRETTSARNDIYRSINNGDTWTLVSTGNPTTNCGIGQHIFFDGTVGLASCHNTFSGSTEGARVSTNGGATWAYIIAPADLTYCGIGSAIQDMGTSYGFTCLNTGFTLFRFMDSTAVAMTPSSQPTPLNFSPFTNPSTIQLDSNDTWLFMGMTTPICCADIHTYKIANGGQDIYEIQESVNRSFAPGRLYQGRNYYGALMISTFDDKFYLLQGH